MDAFIEYTIVGLTVGLFYALVALGYTIVYGIVRLINFAHGDLAMVGSYLGWTLLVPLGLTRLPLTVAVPIVFIVPMVATALLNLGILQIAYRPLLRRSVVALLISSLAMSQILENVAQLVFGPAINAYPQIPLSVAFTIGSTRVSYLQIILLTISIALMLGLYLFTQRTATGTAMRAVAVDHDAARLMGIDVDRMIALAFVAGGLLAAASGVMLGIYYTSVTFIMGFQLGLRAFTAAVFGGIGNIPGAMLGGVLIGLIESYSVGYISSRWSDVIVFGILISILIVRPRGILGERVAERV
jgi:branched-chain amino acid transport system permease protein